MIANQPVRATTLLSEIRLLQSESLYFTQIAQWHHQECERQGLTSSLALRQQRLILHIQKDLVPKTLIALCENELAGCVSLVNYTYRSRDRMPKVCNPSPVWMTNLFTAENMREQGIGNSLIDAAKNYAMKLGLQELWLAATDYTEYYQKRGWEITRRTRLGGRQVNVMRIGLC